MNKSEVETAINDVMERLKKWLWRFMIWTAVIFFIAVVAGHIVGINLCHHGRIEETFMC